MHKKKLTSVNNRFPPIENGVIDISNASKIRVEILKEGNTKNKLTAFYSNNGRNVHSIPVTTSQFTIPITPGENNQLHFEGEIVDKSTLIFRWGVK